MRAEDDAAQGGDGGFSNVQSFLDDGRAQHEQARESSQDDIHQVGLIDGQVVPRHLGCMSFLPLPGDAVSGGCTGRFEISGPLAADRRSRRKGNVRATGGGCFCDAFRPSRAGQAALHSTRLVKLASRLDGGGEMGGGGGNGQDVECQVRDRME